MIKKSYQLNLLLAGLLCAVPFSALAGSEATPADEIVTTATRTPLPLNRVGSSVSVITAAEIELRQYSFVLDALEAAPGVTVNQNGSFGGVASVRIRGAATGQTLVLIDGVEMGDPSGVNLAFNFATLDPNDIERIEVLRGPQSTLYGSDAIGGVVNIITKRGSGPFSANAFLEGGSFATVRGGATVSGQAGKFDYRVSGSGIYTDGISKADRRDGNTEKDGYDNLTFSTNLGVQVTEDIRLSGFARYSDSRTEFDSFGVVTGVQDGDEVNKTEELVLGANLDVSLFEGRFENRFGVGYMDIDRRNFNNGAFSFGAEGSRLAFDYQGTVQIVDDTVLVFGAETEEIRIDNERTDDNITTDSFYGLIQTVLFDAFSVSGGVRHDDHETFGGVTTFRVTGAYDIEETGTIIRATWGEGFKAPSPFQLTFFCCGAPGPAVDLQPETSKGWEVGIEQPLWDDTASIQVTYFKQNTKNLIDFANGQYFNLDRTRSQGVEVIVAVKPTDWLDVTANYTFIDAVDQTTDVRQLRVPRHSAQAEITVTPTAQATVSLGITYNGKELDSRGIVDDWVRVDLRGSYQVTDAVQVYARIENLFDEQYQEVFGYGTPGISGFAGVRGRF